MENHPAVNHPPAPPACATDDQDVVHNLDGRMHGPMSGFLKKHFGNLQYTHEDAFLEIQAAGNISNRCAVPPAVPSPGNFLQWLSNYDSWEYEGARGSWHISSGNVAPEHESDGDSARHLFKRPFPLRRRPTYRRGGTLSRLLASFTNMVAFVIRMDCCVSVVPHTRSSPVSLCGSFLHGFYMRGFLIELRVFDRSGLYCSELFYVQKDFIQFISIVLSYQRMTDQDLGKNNIIETNKGGSYVVLDSVAMPSLGKLYLESQPIASREKLVGTGTTCYRARMPDSNRWNYLLKFKWR